jgi:hypothetical protein
VRKWKALWAVNEPGSIGCPPAAPSTVYLSLIEILGVFGWVANSQPGSGLGSSSAPQKKAREGSSLA